MNRFKSILANTGYFTIGIGVIAGELAISGYDRVAKACDRCVDKGKDAVHPVHDNNRVSVRTDLFCRDQF